MIELINDIKLNFTKSGDKGKDVILLHGWGQNRIMMEAIENFLSLHFVVYNLDLPGFGESDEPKRAYSVEDYSEFLRAFIIKEGIEEPILIGHSFGCRIALHYAFKYPVNRMVLTGAAGIRDKRGLKWYLKTYSYKLGKKVLSLPIFKKQLAAMQDKVGSEDYRNASGIKRETLVKVVNDDVTPFLKDIKTETLLVFGTNDEATHLAKGEMMEKLMPNATLVVFEGDDHYAYFHQAQRFNMVLEAFLKDEYN